MVNPVTILIRFISTPYRFLSKTQEHETLRNRQASSVEVQQRRSAQMAHVESEI